MDQQYLNSVNLNSGTRFAYLVMDIADGKSVPQPPGFRILHWHEDLQIEICLHGVLTVQTLCESVTIGAGQAALLNQNVVHRIQADRSCHYKSILFPRCFLGFYPGSAADLEVDRFLRSGFRILKFDRDEAWQGEVLDALQALLELEQRRPAAQYEYEVLLRLAAVFLPVLRHIPARPLPATQTAERMQRFLAYISQHYAQPLPLAELAASANVSKSECLRCFRQTLQTTPYQYVMEYRLEKAAALLEDTQLPVGTIAEQCGFTQSSYFGKQFRARSGRSPQEYRQQLRAAQAEKK